MQHEIYSQGPDIHFRNMVLNSSGLPYDCFVAGEFWNKRATLYCIPLGAAGGWNDPSNVKEAANYTPRCNFITLLINQIQWRVIDSEVGQTFDLLLEDFDNDGRVDMLLTAFDDRIGVKEGKVYIYTIPDDLL